MAIFKFKLKAIHRLKSQIEDQEKNKFSLAVAALNAEIAKMNRIKSAIAAAIDGFRALSGERFTAGKIKDFNYFIAAMKESAAIQAKAVEEALRKVDAAREALIIATQQREMFDKLRDKAFSRHMAEEKRAEQQSVDELVSYRGTSQSGQFMFN